MTRATLLHVLDRPTALGPAEVRELEQLAQAFPYCQTAHLLLAKAAHDQGTMLAGQRLRRAATYAADRSLLRRLIEEQMPASAAPAEATATRTEPSHVAEAVAEPKAAFEATPGMAAAEVSPVAFADEELKRTEGAIETVPAAFESEEATAPLEVAERETEVAATAEVTHVPESALAPETEEALALVDVEGVLIAPASPGPETDLEAVPADGEALSTPNPAPQEIADEQPAALAPPETPAAAEPSYELPGLVDEWAASAVTRSLGRLDLLPGALAPAGECVYTPAAFTGDAGLGYAYGESSRLGVCLQSLHVRPEAPTPLATAEPLIPATPLPPTGAFFEPDPLLLDHWATHCPPVPLLPLPLDLINNFLRRQPRLTRPAMLSPTPAAQADLSVRSTRAEPELASESLARIFARQGKTARAIEVYEKLMAKQPEKMAYFAAQIQQLQPPA